MNKEQHLEMKPLYKGAALRPAGRSLWAVTGQGRSRAREFKEARGSEGGGPEWADLPDLAAVELDRRTTRVMEFAERRAWRYEERPAPSARGRYRRHPCRALLSLAFPCLGTRSRIEPSLVGVSTGAACCSVSGLPQYWCALPARGEDMSVQGGRLSGQRRRDRRNRPLELQYENVAA